MDPGDAVDENMELSSRNVECGYTFNSRAEAVLHLEFVHGVMAADINPSSATVVPFKKAISFCEPCD
ncbi:hypothetical protein HDU86_000696 [Geranomyces michiganensis]|nr:hypothetical protein HDU86_000696 [Geranomyces michiganensis]